MEERAALYEHLESALLSIGFLLPHTASSRMLGLKTVLERAGMTAREVQLFRGLARQIGWAGSKTGNRKGRGEV
jgi:tRNA/rRNA methyltransferase